MYCGLTLMPKVIMLIHVIASLVTSSVLIYTHVALIYGNNYYANTIGYTIANHYRLILM